MKLQLLPSKQLYFQLNGSQSETLDRLERRTDRSEYMVSQPTDKTFRGMISGNRFKVISSALGRGAFCVLSGTIGEVDGMVKVEIHKVFRIMLSAFLILPVVGLSVMLIANPAAFSGISILVTFIQLLMIRFVFVELVFQFLSRASLTRLRDVLDIEWTNIKS